MVPQCGRLRSAVRVRPLYVCRSGRVSGVEREANGGTVKVKARLVMTYYVCTRRAVMHTPLNASSRPRESTVIPRLSRTSFAPSGGDVVECTVDGGRVTLSSRCAPARDDGLRIGAARNGQCAKHEITLRRMDMGWSRLEAGRDARDFLNRFTFPLSLLQKCHTLCTCTKSRANEFLDWCVCSGRSVCCGFPSTHNGAHRAEASTTRVQYAAWASTAMRLPTVDERKSPREPSSPYQRQGIRGVATTSRGLPRSRPLSHATIAFQTAFLDTLQMLSNPRARAHTAQSAQQPKVMPPQPRMIATLDRAGYVPMLKPLLPQTTYRVMHLNVYEAPPAPTPQRVLNARISPYSILRHAPSIAVQPTIDDRWSPRLLASR